MSGPSALAHVTRMLEAAGCVAADDEARELLRAARGDGDLHEMVSRRTAGEPLAWITGSVRFCGIELHVTPGVYVPRWQSEPLARRAAELLPPTGVAVDVCTGAGNVALVMRGARPGARVLGTESDPLAASCARHNGIEVYEGELVEPLPGELEASVDVMTGVLPYVPTEMLHFLPRDVLRFEPRRALDGGTGGLDVLATMVAQSPRWVRPGGWLLLEAGEDQVAGLRELFAASGFGSNVVLRDGDGDPRGVCGQLARRHLRA